ncbi:MAG: polysaccharide pyruvyl transferase family protein [Deltaproteobacteria bacterium]|nr:polysaccharide pyruvyl transferase family protein [Deltaproteobacteria bacterium]
MNALMQKVMRRANPDRMLQTVMGGLIDAAAFRFNLGFERERWCPGKPLKLLFAGYVGARNTGADVRVEEMLRQMRLILGDENAELSILSVDLSRTAGYFRGIRQIPMPLVYPKFLFAEVPRHHGVVACEGSMFKSKFSNALSTFMTGALGLATSERKLSVGYGAEAGAMDEDLRELVRKYCADSLIVCRNEPSRRILAGLDIRTAEGTDTAWTFRAAPRARAEAILREAGWDGKRKILLVCPINPFWWPIAPSYLKAAALKWMGEYREEHYQSFYFHEFSEENRKKYRDYLSAIAGAVRAFAAKRGLFVALVGMEKLDRRACEDLAKLFEREPPVFVSDDYDMYDLVSVLRRADLMVSSRYHAIVTSMPALVPSAGITMDERITNIMAERGHGRLLLKVDEADLEGKLLDILGRFESESMAVAKDIAKALPRQLELMGKMGMSFMDEVLRVYPEFPARKVARKPENFLPEIPAELREVLEKHS